MNGFSNSRHNDYGISPAFYDISRDLYHKIQRDIFDIFVARGKFYLVKDMRAPLRGTICKTLKIKRSRKAGKMGKLIRLTKLALSARTLILESSRLIKQSGINVQEFVKQKWKNMFLGWWKRGMLEVTRQDWNERDFEMYVMTGRKSRTRLEKKRSGACNKEEGQSKSNNVSLPGVYNLF
jgi:hypothetical protein